MKRFRTAVVFTAIQLVVLFLVSDLYATRIKYVIIDHRQKAFTIFYTILEGMVDMRDPRIWISGEDGITMVKWGEFKKNKDKYIGERIINNEYGESKIEKKFVRLLFLYPINKFGLTWNGGVAITEDDFKYAMSTYLVYTADPEEYKRYKTNDSENDPLNPKYKLKKLL